MRFQFFSSLVQRVSGWSSILVLGLGLALTGLATWYVGRTTRLADQARFNNAVQHSRDAINERVNIYLGLLRSAAALFASDQVHEEQFRAYVSYLRLSQDYPALEGMGFARQVKDADKERFLEESRDAVDPWFAIYPSGERETYYPVVYLEPVNETSMTVIGFDVFTEGTRQSAMLHARDLGKAAMSSKVTLKQEGLPTEERSGCVIYLPLYEGTVPPHDIFERRERLLGFVFGGFRTERLFSGIFATETEPPVHYDVYDGTLTHSDNLLYSSRASAAAQPVFTTRQRLDVPGHIWTLEFRTTPHFEAASPRRWTVWILAVGTITSLVLFGTSEALRRAAHDLTTTNSALEQRVEERTMRLRETIADLEQFSYSLTHDLRAPLRAMQGYAQLLLDEATVGQPVRREYLRRIATASERMDKLIRDSLNYARVVRGEIELEPVEPRPVLEGVVESYPAYQPPQADVRIEGQFPTIYANEAGLVQCASNLLANAVKFAKPGATPEIRIWAESDGEWVRLLFSDKGVGIPDEAQERIFQMFQRAHPIAHDEGTGVGLAIVRKLSARMGGRVGIRSERGRGSTFWLELPRYGGQVRTKSNERRHRIIR